jgi:multidrug efflux pump subunit AcrA (membrane-fusion protein)
MSVTLPGTTAAFADANVYARATGYIARRNVDIGDRVKAGEVLAQGNRAKKFWTNGLSAESVAIH